MSNIIHKINELNQIEKKTESDIILLEKLNNILDKISKIDQETFGKYYSATIKMLEADLIKFKNKEPIDKETYQKGIEVLLYLTEINQVLIVQNLNLIKSVFPQTTLDENILFNDDEHQSKYSLKNLNFEIMNETIDFILSIRTK